MHGVDVHPSLSSLPFLTSHRTQGYLWGWGQEGNTSTKQCSPWLEPPRVQAPDTGLVYCGWTPVSKQIIQKQQTYKGRGVVISSIKYSTHPDIRPDTGPMQV